MTMTAAETFSAPQAWTASDIESVEDISFHLTPAHLAALEECLDSVKRDGVALADIKPEHFRHPSLDADFAEILEELMFGRGVIVFRGLPADRLDADDIAKMYWGIGTHFGVALSQSALGDVLGHVVDLTKPGEEEIARGYTTARSLRLHTDIAQVVALLCYRPAAAGGVSLIANAFAIHNQIAAENPEYLPILYRGFHYHRRGAQAPTTEPITPHRIPVFSKQDGHLSIFYVREILQSAVEESGIPLSADELAALDTFDACAREQSCRFRLERGDALFMNNRTTLHARTKFENGEAGQDRRHLMRLWLDVPNKRPEVKELQIYENEGGRGGIDGQEGRERAGVRYRTLKMAE